MSPGGIVQSLKGKRWPPQRIGGLYAARGGPRSQWQLTPSPCSAHQAMCLGALGREGGLPGGGDRRHPPPPQCVNELNQWLSALRKVSISNPGLLGSYHPGIFRGDKWSCCHQKDKSGGSGGWAPTWHLSTLAGARRLRALACWPGWGPPVHLWEQTGSGPVPAGPPGREGSVTGEFGKCRVVWVPHVGSLKALRRRGNELGAVSNAV